MPVGLGYDAHRFAAGRALVLGGVEIASEIGLLGHSDADVIAHAVMDALLGAAGLGDIGQHFPPTDPAYAGANSLDLLRQVARLLAGTGSTIVNVDVMVVAERPKLAPYVGEMRRRLGEAAGVEAKRVSIKATTNEGMGFIGRGEGVAALAVAEIVTVETTELSPAAGAPGSASHA